MGFNNTNRSKLILDGENKGALSAINGVTKQLGSAERQMKGFGSGISGSLGAFTSFLNPTFAIAGAITGVATGFGAMIKASIDSAEQLDKMSQRVGFSVESLSTLKYAGQLAGIEFESLTNGLSKFSKNLFDVSNGVGQTAVYGFESLGVNVLNTNGSLREASELLPEVANRFALMKDGSEKTAIAMTLFGRSGRELIPLLNQGAAGLEAMQMEARDLGLEISTNTAKSAADFKDNMVRLESVLQGLANKAMPLVTRELNKLLATAQDPSWQNIWALWKDHSIWGFFTEDEENLRNANKLTKEIFNNIAASGPIYNIFTGALVKSTEEIIAQSKEAEKLAAQWQVTQKSLMYDIATTGLPKTYAEFVKIDQKVADLQSKFGDKQIIKDWAESVRLALIEAQDIPVKLEADVPIYDGKMMMFGLDQKEFDRSFYDAQIEAIADVNNAQMASWLLQQQGTVDMFGNMSDAMMGFYQSSGERNKLAFEAYKLFAKGETVIATIQAAQNAYTWASAWGGPIAGGIAAGAASLAGLARISQINATQMGSNYPGNAGSSGGVASYQTTNNNTNNNGQTYITIQLTAGGDSPDWDSVAREKIIPAIEKYVSYGGSVRVN